MKNPAYQILSADDRAFIESVENNPESVHNPATHERINALAQLVMIADLHLGREAA